MKKYIVFYVNFPQMRERIFDNLKDAEIFAATVNGSVCEI